MHQKKPVKQKLMSENKISLLNFGIIFRLYCIKINGAKTAVATINLIKFKTPGSICLATASPTGNEVAIKMLAIQICICPLM
tara:strand:+ start:320 stop:565 length:246 start_codon:yes stop_codon:yes gene_type:complete